MASEHWEPTDLVASRIVVHWENWFYFKSRVRSSCRCILMRSPVSSHWTVIPDGCCNRAGDYGIWPGRRQGPWKYVDAELPHSEI
jgi:hypothetical protein